MLQLCFLFDTFLNVIKTHAVKETPKEAKQEFEVP
jgi:hypothetical protein